MIYPLKKLQPILAAQFNTANFIITRTLFCYMDFELEKEICINYWNNVSSTDGPKAARPRNESNIGSESSTEAGFVCNTPSWEEIQRSINFACSWCDILIEEIEFCYRHITKSRRDPPLEATFYVAVQFARQRVGSYLCPAVCVENDWSSTRLCLYNI